MVKVVRLTNMDTPSATVQCLGVIQPLEMVVDRSELRVIGVASTISCEQMEIKIVTWKVLAGVDS